MKKTYILLIVLVTLAACTCPQQKTFKNPIFYERLQSFNEEAYEFDITPTSMDWINAGIHSCELIEDNTTNVLLRCLHSIRKLPEQSVLVKDKDFYLYTRFVSIGKIEKYPDKCIFLLFSSKDLKKLDQTDVGERFVPWKDCGPTEPQSKYESFLDIKK